jgi:hypothetical protein
LKTWLSLVVWESLGITAEGLTPLFFGWFLFYFFEMGDCYVVQAGFKTGSSCSGLLSNWGCKQLPSSDLVVLQEPISWRNLISSSAKIHGPTTHTWNESQQRGWASQGHWPQSQNWKCSLIHKSQRSRQRCSKPQV